MPVPTDGVPGNAPASHNGHDGVACKSGPMCYNASSTSAAAALAAADPYGATAAISSALAAQAHLLDILLEGLEDDPENATRFVVLKQKCP